MESRKRQFSFSCSNEDRNYKHVNHHDKKTPNILVFNDGKEKVPIDFKTIPSKFIIQLTDEIQAKITIRPTRTSLLLLDARIREPIKEMLFKCFCFVELCNMRLVCKQLKQIIDPILEKNCTTRITKEIDRKIFPHKIILDSDSVTQKDINMIKEYPIESLTLVESKRYQTLTAINLSELNDLKKLKLYLPFSKIFINSSKSNNITHLKIGLTPVYSFYYLKMFENLRSLKLTTDNLQCIKHISKMNKLEELRITININDQSNWTNIMKLTQLTKLTISVNVEENTMEELALLTNLKKLQSFRYCGQEKKLLPIYQKLNFKSIRMFIDSWPDNYHLNVEKLYISDYVAKQIPDLTKWTNLKTLRLNGTFSFDNMKERLPSSLKTLIIEKEVLEKIIDLIPNTVEYIILIIWNKNKEYYQEYLELLKSYVIKYPQFIIRFK